MAVLPVLPVNENFSFGEGKTALLFIHGFTSNPRIFLPLVQELCKNYHCESVLLAGHGSDPEDMAQKGHWNVWLRQCRDAALRLKTTHAHVYAVGHSMGGLLALLLGAEGLVDGVCDLAAPLLFRGEKKARWAFFLWPFCKYLSWEKGTTVKEEKPDETEKEEISTYNIGYPYFPVRCVVDMRRLSAMAREQLGNLKCPLLVIQGGRDTQVPAETNDLFENCPSVYKKIEILPDAPHAMLVGKYKMATLTLLQNFLQEAETLRFDAERDIRN